MSISMPGISIPGILTLVSTAMSMRVSLNAMAMAVSVAAMTSPSEADFVYVPPREPAAAAESGKDRAPVVHEAATEKNARGSDGAHGGPEKATTHTNRIDAHRWAAAPLRVATPRRVETPRYADAEPLAKSSSAGLRQVRAGETLREALDRWGDNAGIEVLFLTDRRYRLHEGRAFPGSFDEAARTLFAALSHLSHPPAGEMRPGGRTLAVLHKVGQSRPAGDSR